MAVKPVVYDDTTKKHRPLGSGEKMDGLSASSIISADSGNLIATGSDGLAYATGSGIADPAADNLIEATAAGKLKVDMDRIIEWLDGHPSDAEDVADAISVVSGDSGNLVSKGSDKGAYMASDGLTVVLNGAGKLSVGDISGVEVAASGASAERALEDRFADVVNVKDFGAKGDGTSDDTVAWAAWQAALRSGGIGYVPAGTYLVAGGPVRVPHGCIGTLDAINGTVYPPNGEVTESDGLLNSTRSAEYADGTVSAPHIAIRDTAEHIDDDAETSENFIRGVGIYEELKITGRSANPSEAATQNFSGIYAVTRNEAKGWIGGTSVQARYYEGNKPTDAGWKNNKGCAVGGISFGYGKHSQGGYCAGGEIDMIEQYDGEAECPVYPNNDWRDPAFVKRQTRALLLGAGGKQPVLDGLVVVGFGENEPCGCWNGITIGGTAMKIAGNSEGAPGTVGLNLATWRTGQNGQSGQYGDIGIKFGTANRHIHAREGLKIASDSNTLIARSNTEQVSRIISGGDVYDGGGDTYSTASLQFMSIDDVDLYTPGAGTNTDTEHYAVFHGSLSSTNQGMILRSVRECAIRVDGLAQDAVPAYVVFDKVSFRPGYSLNDQDEIVVDDVSLGQADAPWSNVRATTGPWAESDARKKDNQEAPSDALMRAWGKVNFKVFQFKDAIAKKGAAEARLHVGVIAQEVQEAFASEGLDASRYGLFGYDSWEDEYEDVRVVDAEQVLDGDQNVVAPERAHNERRLVRPAGDAYSIRYEEALALECAYQRWRLEQIEARLNAVGQPA